MSMANKVFCVNMKTRPDRIDLDNLPGLTWGCGEIYREWTPDRLVSVDHKLNHEIYRSGYALENICYFRYWLKRSAVDLDKVVGTYQERIDFAEYINESENSLGYNHFVASGGNDGSLIFLKQMVEKYRDEVYFDESVRARHGDVYITWCAEKDKVISTGTGYLPCPVFVIDHTNMATWQSHDPSFYDYEYDVGPTSVHLASHHDKPHEVYLIGHDSLSDYSGVPFKGITPAENRIAQYEIIFEKYPNIQYYKVESGLGNGLWREMNNVEVIDYASIRFA